MHGPVAKFEKTVLALLYTTSFEQGGARCAWKTYDWDITERLFEQGFIDDPRNNRKSVVLTPEGEKHAKALAEKLFGSSRLETPPVGTHIHHERFHRARSGHCRAAPDCRGPLDAEAGADMTPEPAAVPPTRST
jgi:hypothetical protein